MYLISEISKFQVLLLLCKFKGIEIRILEGHLQPDGFSGEGAQILTRFP